MSDILAETPDRFLLLPVRDEQAWQFYQEAVACFWTAQELDLTHDVLHPKALPDGASPVPPPIYRDFNKGFMFSQI
eukprot:COSAG02_NODE_83_length_39665_cov_25.213719_4_plen_76_part_00